jgi:Dienelactone hydrolase family
LKAAGAKYEAHTYTGTQHGFNNDTTPRFDAVAAKQAWDRTMAFFKEHLGSVGVNATSNTGSGSGQSAVPRSAPAPARPAVSQDL